jgi:metal transporter CNNM
LGNTLSSSSSNKFNSSSSVDSREAAASASALQSASSGSAPPSVKPGTLTLYFTPENDCADFMKYNYRPFEIVEKIESHMYKAKLSGIVLQYSEKPLYICMQQFDLDENIHDQFRYYSHQGNDYWVAIITTKDVIPIWARIILFVMLLTLSGLFSGLNLGLMSLDISELDILKRIGTEREQSYASKIYPLRKRGNFLLCTILLGNVLVNSVSTLILGDMLSGVYAALGSTLLIVIFGEIIPQAACSKHGLAVGAHTRYIMYLFMVLTSPLSFPLSIVLDKILGQEIAAPYSREKIRELMNFVEGLDNKEKKIISGALDFNKKKVSQVMTKIEDVFMLDKRSCLDFESIAKIAQEGYSRIPVYEGSKDNVVGLLHVKDFTLLDPDDNMPVEALIKFYNHPINFCEADNTIDAIFDEFRQGESHLAFVTDIQEVPDRDPIKVIVGIVTLEDILEELVQMEIYDEFDDNRERKRMLRFFVVVIFVSQEKQKS